MVEKWIYLLYILQNFLTFEGSYSLTYIYHILLLIHFKSRKLINFPHFLLKILYKLSRTVKKDGRDQIGFKLFHYGLIKILVRKELENRRTTWEIFLKIIHGESIVKRSRGRNQLEKGRKKFSSQ